MVRIDEAASKGSARHIRQARVCAVVVRRAHGFAAWCPSPVSLPGEGHSPADPPRRQGPAQGWQGRTSGLGRAPAHRSTGRHSTASTSRPGPTPTPALGRRAPSPASALGRRAPFPVRLLSRGHLARPGSGDVVRREPRRSCPGRPVRRAAWCAATKAVGVAADRDRRRQVLGHPSGSDLHRGTVRRVSCRSRRGRAAGRPGWYGCGIERRVWRPRSEYGGRPANRADAAPCRPGSRE